MEILNQNSPYPTEVALILGYFDGVHIGHKAVIKSAVDFAKSMCKKTLLITFNPSPAEYFYNKQILIFEREYSYKLIEELGVDYLLEVDFTKIANISAEEYLKKFLIEKFRPISISTGCNHTFGANRQGNSELLKEYSKEFNYNYFCVSSHEIDTEIVSSTLIKDYIQKGEVEQANKLLGKEFLLTSEVTTGLQIGRKIGFPTANLDYPKDIVKLPYGVYVVEVFNKKAIMNWGVKPTIGGEEAPILEVHIPKISIDLYGKILNIKVIKKIRNEKKFNSLDALQKQIFKDIEECLK